LCTSRLLHGFDYDHIAAISDITSVQQKLPIAMRLGSRYVLGHVTMIALLGEIVILFQLSSAQVGFMGRALGRVDAHPTLACGRHYSWLAQDP
jgi:high-affinity nickel permease